MTDMNLKLVALLKEILNTEHVDLNSEVGKPYQWDSLKHISLIIKIEEMFEVRIPPTMIARLSSIAAITDFITKDRTRL